MIGKRIKAFVENIVEKVNPIQQIKTAYDSLMGVVVLKVNFDQEDLLRHVYVQAMTTGVVDPLLVNQLVEENLVMPRPPTASINEREGVQYIAHMHCIRKFTWTCVHFDFDNDMELMAIREKRNLGTNDYR